jgi:hypothetical protein
MELTYDNILKWFENYFKAFNQNNGPLKTVANMEKYFTQDMEFWSYNKAGMGKAAPRESLLRTMVHPGLHEELTPQEYVIDLKRLVVVVQFQVQFSDAPSGRVWKPTQARAHYYLVPDKDTGLKIKKILYFTEYRPPEDTGNLMELWKAYREKALAEN